MKKLFDRALRVLLLAVAVGVAVNQDIDKRPAPYRTGRGSAHETLDKA